MTVDDAHWADTASLRFLAYLAPRLADLPMTVVVALRPGHGGDLLGQLVADPVAELLHLRALTERAVGELVDAALVPKAAPDFVRACRRATGGNPFLLRELLAELARGGITPDAAAAHRVGRTSPRRCPSRCRSD